MVLVARITRLARPRERLTTSHLKSTARLTWYHDGDLSPALTARLEVLERRRFYRSVAMSQSKPAQREGGVPRVGDSDAPGGPATRAKVKHRKAKAAQGLGLAPQAEPDRQEPNGEIGGGIAAAAVDSRETAASGSSWLSTALRSFGLVSCVIGTIIQTIIIYNADIQILDVVKEVKRHLSGHAAESKLGCLKNALRRNPAAAKFLPRAHSRVPILGVGIAVALVGAHGRFQWLGVVPDLWHKVCEALRLRETAQSGRDQ